MTNYQIIKLKAIRDTLEQNAKRAELAKRMSEDKLFTNYEIYGWLLILAFACYLIK